MNDADIKITGGFREAAEIEAKTPMTGSPRRVSNLMPIAGCIENQKQSLYDDLIQARQQLRALQEALLISDANTRHWKERAEWLERKQKHGCCCSGPVYCPQCDGEIMQ